MHGAQPPFRGLTSDQLLMVAQALQHLPTGLLEDLLGVSEAFSSRGSAYTGKGMPERLIMSRAAKRVYIKESKVVKRMRT